MKSNPAHVSVPVAPCDSNSRADIASDTRNFPEGADAGPADQASAAWDKAPSARLGDGLMPWEKAVKARLGDGLMPWDKAPQVRIGDGLMPWANSPKVRLGDGLMPW